MSRPIVTISLVALLMLSGSIFYALSDNRDTSPGSLESPTSASSGSTHPSVEITPAAPAADITPPFIPSLPTATIAPTMVLPRSGPHNGLPRSIPLAYFHIAPDEGEPADTLADRASFITLTHGDEDYRNALRVAGYQGLILQFLVASEVNGPGPYADASADCDEAFRPLRNGIARDRGEFCREIHPNEDWFLHNGEGQRLYDRIGETGVWYHLDPSNPGWREYALNRIRDDAVGPNALGFDGVFLDNVELSMVKVAEQLANSDGTVLEYQSDEEYREAWIEYLEVVSQAIRGEVELWANMAADPNDGSSWEPFLLHVDGAMFPAFATGYRGLSVARWVNNLTQAEAALSLGKGVVAVGLGNQGNEQLQQFAAASFLLIAGVEGAYFRYVSSESREALNSFWLYDNYDVTLGEPLGPRYRIGEIWRRDFNCGYVVANPAETSSEIVQTECAVEPR